ncbi:hypothetical protein DES53_1154 [Roseimicrobium gellanilyticum]|uniref:Uncharacterized protein n=1 Tax=Roseimicrobium gellanilyticum TaxID=748857 RepID=A0A366H4C7_9BACT|nr:hypothetical protein DES53_1154 [Roseimicrobium gellanilyticum]
MWHEEAADLECWIPHAGQLQELSLLCVKLSTM